MWNSLSQKKNKKFQIGRPRAVSRFGLRKVIHQRKFGVNMIKECNLIYWIKKPPFGAFLLIFFYGSLFFVPNQNNLSGYCRFERKKDSWKWLMFIQYNNIIWILFFGIYRLLNKWLSCYSMHFCTVFFILYLQKMRRDCEPKSAKENEEREKEQVRQRQVVDDLERARRNS